MSKKHWLVYGGLLLLICVILLASVTVGMLTRGGVRNIRLGPDTTFITKPLAADGTVDYVLAINRLMAAELRPGENAAVDLLMAFGPQTLEPRLRPQYYAELGMPPLPAEGDYFVELTQVAKEDEAAAAAPTDAAAPANVTTASDAAAPTDAGQRTEEQAGLEADEQLEACRTRPWTAHDYPLIDQWLRRNEEPLQSIVRASGRSGYYFPMLSSDGSSSLVMALLPLATNSRNAVRLLCARATRSWGEGRVDAALDDCLAALRLGRLQSRSLTLVDSLVAIACQRITCITLEQIATAPEITAQQLRALIDELEKLAPMTPLWKKLDRGERYFYLSATTMIARDGVQQLAIQTGGSATEPSALTSLASSAIDWNVVLREGNRWYDEMVRVGRITDYRQFQQAAEQLDQQISQQAGQLASVGQKLRSLATIQGRSQMMATVMTSMMAPSLQAAYRAEYRDTMQFRVTITSLWIAVYHQERGTYPDRLEQLVPNYLPAIPVDLFDGQPLRYRRSDDGYVLYSIGPDGVDNGGSDLDGSDGDLAVRVPKAVAERDD